MFEEHAKRVARMRPPKHLQMPFIKAPNRGRYAIAKAIDGDDRCLREPARVGRGDAVTVVMIEEGQRCLVSPSGRNSCATTRRLSARDQMAGGQVVTRRFMARVAAVRMPGGV